MDLAFMQIEAGRGVCFEHPMEASTWKHPRMLKLLGMKNMQKIRFDGCCFGAKTKIEHTPVLMKYENYYKYLC